MLEVVGDLWEYPADARVIATNGHVNIKDCLTMGRGSAHEAAERFPALSYYLGHLIKAKGNNVIMIGPSMLSSLMNTENDHRYSAGDEPLVDYSLYTYPTKNFWRDKSDFVLIRRSAEQLVAYIDRMDHKTVVMPRVGAGNGRLEWSQVRTVLEPILDERFHVITYG